LTGWLLDTTYILPFFGIEVNIAGITQALDKILVTRRHDIAIASVSIIEAKWKIIKEYNTNHVKASLDRVNLAIEGLSSGQYMKIIDPWTIMGATTAADRLLVLGYADYFDCWIAGIAKCEHRILVTEDGPLIKFIQERARWPDFKSMSWNNFVDSIDTGDS
jgi:predicted nucleic acid-binding protein